MHSICNSDEINNSNLTAKRSIDETILQKIELAVFRLLRKIKLQNSHSDTNRKLISDRMSRDYWLNPQQKIKQLMFCPCDSSKICNNRFSHGTVSSNPWSQAESVTWMEYWARSPNGDRIRQVGEVDVNAVAWSDQLVLFAVHDRARCRGLFPGREDRDH